MNVQNVSSSIISPHISDTTVDIKQWQKAVDQKSISEIRKIIPFISQKELLQQDDDGNTVLHRFAIEGDYECIQALEPRFTEEMLNVENNDGESPLWSSLYSENEKVFAFLLQHTRPYQLRHRDKNGDTLVHHIARSGCLGVMEALAPQCEEELLGIENNQGEIALFSALLGVREDVFSLLLKHTSKQQLHHQDQRGDTLVHHLVRAGDFKILQLLPLECIHTLLEMKNKQGDIALTYAIKSGKDEAISTFLFTHMHEKIQQNCVVECLLEAISKRSKGLTELFCKHVPSDTINEQFIVQTIEQGIDFSSLKVLLEKNHSLSISSQLVKLAVYSQMADLDLLFAYIDPSVRKEVVEDTLFMNHCYKNKMLAVLQERDSDFNDKTTSIVSVKEKVSLNSVKQCLHGWSKEENLAFNLLRHLQYIDEEKTESCRRRKLYVAKDIGNNIRGVMAATIVEAEKDIYIDYLIADPFTRNKGIGSSLLRKGGQKAKKLSSSLFPKNEKNLQKNQEQVVSISLRATITSYEFYEKFHFTCVEKKRYRITTADALQKLCDREVPHVFD